MPLTEAQKRRIEEEELHRRQIAKSLDVVHSNQKYGLPALLSFFIPGLGQMVKGQVGKGILVFIVWLLSFILIITVIGAIAPLIIYIWQIADAYNDNPQKISTDLRGGEHHEEIS